MIPSVSFTPEFLGLVVGALFSILFSYVPKLNVWFAALSTEAKQLSMLGLMLLSTAAIFGLGCGNIIPINDFVCNQSTAVYFIYVFILSVLSNQGTYKITPQTLAVRQAKEIVVGDELYKGSY